MLGLLILFAQLIIAVAANTEKAIFLGPSKLPIPIQNPTLKDVHLDILSPLRWSLRTHIEAEFPTNISKYGQSSWLLLNGLGEGQRYEVRICWAATQPTSFRLETYELPDVFENPDLFASLAKYSKSRQPYLVKIQDQEPSNSVAAVTSKHTFEDSSSLLLLRVLAAADYFTMNKTLMAHVPPVLVDIILDPYVFNIFPRSLILTASYIIMLAVGGWFISKHISRWLSLVATTGADPEKKTR